MSLGSGRSMGPVRTNFARPTTARSSEAWRFPWNTSINLAAVRSELVKNGFIHPWAVNSRAACPGDGVTVFRRIASGRQRQDGQRRRNLSHWRFQGWADRSDATARGGISRRGSRQNAPALRFNPAPDCRFSRRVLAPAIQPGSARDRVSATWFSMASMAAGTACGPVPRHSARRVAGGTRFGMHEPVADFPREIRAVLPGDRGLHHVHWCRPASAGDAVLVGHVEGAVRKALRRPERESVHRRALRAEAMVYSVIAMSLFRQASAREALRCLMAGLRWVSPELPVRVSGKSSISRAHRRPGPQPFAALREARVRPLAAPRRPAPGTGAIV